MKQEDFDAAWDNVMRWIEMDDPVTDERLSAALDPAGEEERRPPEPGTT